MSAASFGNNLKALAFSLAVFCPLFLRAQDTAAVPYVSGAEDIALGEIILEDLAAAADREDGPTLMVRAARQMMGQSYVAGTQEGREERLRLFLTKTDCILFAENCLGLVHTARRCGTEATFEDLAVTVCRSRYRDGVVDGYPSRLHYTTEWIAQGVRTGIFEDVTEKLGGVPDTRPIRYMSEHPGSYAPLAGESTSAQENLRRIRAVEERLDGQPRHYIPKERITAAEVDIRSGDILCFATSIDGLDYSHVVIAYREKPGDRLGFIHASSTAKKVIVEPRTLEAYLQANRRIVGVTVLRVP
jgi:hypothetical protein